MKDLQKCQELRFSPNIKIKLNREFLKIYLKNEKLY